MRNPGTLLLSGALLAASGLVVGLGRRLQALSTAYVEVRRQATTLHGGSVVPVFRAPTIQGDSLTIGELPDTASRQLLFVLTTTCPYCRATLPIWAKLADSARKLHPDVRVAAISLDSADPTRAYATKYRLDYPLVRFPDWRTRRLYRAGRVPTTMVLNAEGVVLYARIGLLRDSAVVDSIYLALRGGRASAAAQGSGSGMGR